MSEIEFDEIDKAVSSALGSAPSDNQETVAVNRGTSSSEIHVHSSAPKTLRSSLASRRSGGRFMDVVHPSSDMKTGTKPEPTAKPTYAFPTGEVADASLEDTLDTTTLEDSNESMGSPFIVDAKVEKRPLGAFSEMGQVEVNEDVLDETLDTPMPAELNKDVLNLESNQALPETPVAGETTDITEEAPVEEQKTPVELEKSDEAEPPVPSIIQQYQEKPSSTSEQSGAIFDTEQYHAPLAHTPKKKTGWLVVLWIFALVVLGAGLGAVGYYFVLPSFL